MRNSALVFLLFGITNVLLASNQSERVTFRVNGKQRTAIGNVVVEASDGGILLRTPHQTMWPLQPNDIIARETLPDPLQPLKRSELVASVLRDLPAGFRVHQTNHYIICYNTSKAYAEWCGAMFERLHRAFYNYWSRRRIDMEDTPPLVACVFRNKKSYQAYGRPELGDTVDSILGYYSYKTNRIALYDLLGGRAANAASINQFMRTERTVATVIHEATHQIAFNSGMHQRFSDIPLWLSEGLAIFFETPDLRSTRGWRTIGKVNQVRLRQFIAYAQRRPADSLLSLVGTDDRFQKLGSARSAYAESWAFVYFLIKTKSDEFADYLQILQQKPPSVRDTQEQRVADFVNAFGKPPQAFNEDFLKHIRRIR